MEVIFFYENVVFNKKKVSACAEGSCVFTH